MEPSLEYPLNKTKNIMRVFFSKFKCCNDFPLILWKKQIKLKKNELLHRILIIFINYKLWNSFSCLRKVRKSQFDPLMGDVPIHLSDSSFMWWIRWGKIDQTNNTYGGAQPSAFHKLITNWSENTCTGLCFSINLQVES